jgi:DNA-directed RNA polymerase specialized sigma24 family protein
MTLEEPNPKPTNSRVENQTYQEWSEARRTRLEEWPEPETSRLYHTLRRAALLIAYTILHKKDPDLARDIATKALLKVEQFRNETLFSTWFYRIAVNSAVSLQRHQFRQRETQLDLVSEPEAASIIATPAMLSAEGLKPREKQLLGFLLENTQGSRTLKQGTRPNDLSTELDMFAKQQNVTPRYARKIWQKLREKLKSTLSC